jgi:hypothetical protein
MFEAKSTKVEFGAAAAAVAMVVLVLVAVEVVLLLLLLSVRETAVVGILLLSSIPNANGNSSSNGAAVNNATAANKSTAAVLVKERCGWFL